MEQVFYEALAHHNAGRLDEAETLYGGIVAWRPAWVLGNLGAIYRTTGRLADAEDALRQALAADPANVRTQHSLGMTLLQRGKYAEGWALYEARHALYDRPRAAFQEWRGESLRGKQILVVGEQGYGDQILWLRFLPLLAELAAEVFVVVDAPLAPLLEGMPVRVVPTRIWRSMKADVWTSLGSVPRWLGAGPSDAPAPYLAARGQTGRGSGGLGVMLQGGAKNPNPARIPTGDVAQAIRGLAPFTDLDPEVSGAADFGATAQIMAGLDGVVSVDTSVAHLAGAMGRLCWVLMTRPAVDWYANWDDDRSPWYPSLRIVRQRDAGDWSGVVADLRRRLATMT